MLDPKFVRENFAEVKERLSLRNDDFSYLDNFLTLDEERRKIIVEVEELKARKNTLSKQIGIYKRENKDITPLLQEMDIDDNKIKELDERLREIEDEIKNILLNTPIYLIKMFHVEHLLMIM